jgi:hypothetical protein
MTCSGCTKAPLWKRLRNAFRWRCNCAKRLTKLYKTLGYTRAEQGWWTLRTRNGSVALDVKPSTQFRSDVSGLVVRGVL